MSSEHSSSFETKQYQILDGTSQPSIRKMKIKQHAWMSQDNRDCITNMVKEASPQNHHINWRYLLNVDIKLSENI